MVSVGLVEKGAVGEGSTEQGRVTEAVAEYPLQLATGCFSLRSAAEESNQQIGQRFQVQVKRFIARQAL